MAREAVARGERVEWLCIDERDVVPATLIPRIDEALREAVDGAPCLLVLDDLHRIEGSPSLALLSRLLANLPSRLRVLITSRSLPELELERRRAEGRLVELGPQELRFTEEEARGFASAALPFDAPKEVLDSVLEMNQGWPACLRLSVLASKNAQELERLVNNFGSEHRYLADYLTAQFLDTLSPEWLSVLETAALTESADAALLDALLGPGARPEIALRASGGPAGAQALLEEAERRNLLLFARDPTRRRFGLHALLRGRLLASLALSDPRRLRELRLKASRLLEARGEIDEAIELSIEAEDFERAKGLIASSYWLFLARNATGAALRWLARLPPSIARDSWELRYLEAWGEAIAGRFDEALGILSSFDATTALREGYTISRLAMAKESVDVYVERFRDPESCVPRAKALLETLPADDLRRRGQTLFSLGDALFSLGRMEEAEASLLEAERELMGSGHNSAALGACHVHFQLLAERKDIARAGRMIDTMRSIVASDPGLYSGGIMEADSALLLLEEGETQAALRLLEGSLREAEIEGSYSYNFNAVALMARALLDAGRVREASEQLTRLEALAAQGECERFLRVAAGLRQRLEKTGGTEAGAKARRTISPRERQILLLLEEGLSYKEMAARLGISLHTVCDHIKRLYEKLAAHNAREAISEARAAGILEGARRRSEA